MKDVIPKDTCTEGTPPSQGVETPVRAQTGGDATGSGGAVRPRHPVFLLLLYPRGLSSCSPCPQRIHVSHLRPRPMPILSSPGGQAVFPPLTHPQRVSSQSEESARRPSPLGCAAPFCPFHAGHIWVWRSDPKPIRLALRAHSKIQCGQRKTQRERRQRAPVWPGFPGTRLTSLAAGPPTNRDSGSPPEKEATGFRKPLCHVPFVTLLWQPEIPGFSNFPTSYDLPNPPCPDPRRAA